MIKCIICENYQRAGAKHTCSKCKTKIIYGVMQEPFIECCQFFSMTEIEKQRWAYFNKINSLPIDDRGHGGRPRREATEVKGNEKNIHKRKNNRQRKL